MPPHIHPSTIRIMYAQRIETISNPQIDVSPRLEQFVVLVLNPSLVNDVVELKVYFSEHEVALANLS